MIAWIILHNGHTKQLEPQAISSLEESHCGLFFDEPIELGFDCLLDFFERRHVIYSSFTSMAVKGGSYLFWPEDFTSFLWNDPRYSAQSYSIFF